MVKKITLRRCYSKSTKCCNLLVLLCFRGRFEKLLGMGSRGSWKKKEKKEFSKDGFKIQENKVS